MTEFSSVENSNDEYETEELPDNFDRMNNMYE